MFRDRPSVSVKNCKLDRFVLIVTGIIAASVPNSGSVIRDLLVCALKKLDFHLSIVSYMDQVESALVGIKS